MTTARVFGSKARAVGVPGVTKASNTFRGGSGTNGRGDPQGGVKVECVSEAPRQRGRAWPALVMASALTIVFAVVAGLAASAARSELTRGPTPAEVRRASAEEVARRWRTWPAGRIFPETVAYAAEQGGLEKARRVGISSETRCGPAVDPGLRPALRQGRCQAVLRATYLDALQGVLVTVGLVALPDEAAALTVKAALPQGDRPTPGLRALAFPGTVADRFTAAGRQTGSVRQAGPYLVLTTVGQVDGRPARAVGGQRAGMFAFAADMSERILDGLVTPPSPDCAFQEWRC
jgi:hypothetical protein